MTSHLHPDMTRNPGHYPCGSCPDTLATAAERTVTASCPSPAHADELADFGDCSECGTVAPRLPAPKASAAETPGTIASAQAFGWGA